MIKQSYLSIRKIEDSHSQFCRLDFPSMWSTLGQSFIAVLLKDNEISAGLRLKYYSKCSVLLSTVTPLKSTIYPSLCRPLCGHNCPREYQRWALAKAERMRCRHASPPIKETQGILHNLT